MKDSEFKNFKHCLPKGSQIHTTGQNLISGYKPDVSIINTDEKVHIILESERKSDRKTFIGAYIKASHFSQTENIPVTLVFVMKETGNQTTTSQVSSNLEPYFFWLKELGATKLNRICFITHENYLVSASCNEAILSDNFLKRCITLK